MQVMIVFDNLYHIYVYIYIYIYIYIYTYTYTYIHLIQIVKDNHMTSKYYKFQQHSQLLRNYSLIAKANTNVFNQSSAVEAPTD